MADDADRAGERMELEMDLVLSAFTEAARLDPGKPGDCDLCGEWSGRLIGGACAPCRDQRGRT